MFMRVDEYKLVIYKYKSNMQQIEGKNEMNKPKHNGNGYLEDILK